MPRVSVVMSVYNSARWLTPAIESVLAQTFVDFELICVDDGSTDASPRILSDFAVRDARVRVLRQANAGVAVAGNAGIDAARGALIARLDSDDYAMPERLARQVAFMDANPGVVLLGTAYQMIDQDDRLLTTHHQPADDAELQRRCLVGTIPIAHSGCMYRRAAAIEVGKYDLAFPSAEDLDLYLRLGEVGEMACLPDVLLKYRQHATSLSESRQALQIERMRVACERAWTRRGLAGMTFEGAPWRAVGTRASLYAQHCRFGWWTFAAGSRSGAIHYGWRGVKLLPWRMAAWKLLLCAALNRRPTGPPVTPATGARPRKTTKRG